MKYSLIGSARTKAAIRVMLPVALASLAAPLGAQVLRAPTAVAQRHVATEILLLPDGGYVLTLTPAALKEKSSTSHAPAPMELDVDVMHSGGSVTVTVSDGTVLTGTASASHLKTSGLVKASTLTVEVGGTGSTAGGTFVFAGHGANRIAGTAAFAPAPRRAAHKKSGGMGGCSGLVSCASMIWHFFAD